MTGPNPSARSTAASAPRLQLDVNSTEVASFTEWQDRFILSRLRVALWLGLIGNLQFIVLDFIIYPAHFRSLLILRGLIELGLLGMLFLRRTVFVQQHPAWVIVGIIGSLNFPIAHMTMIVGGFASPYYSGLNLVFLGISVIIPCHWRFHTLAQSSVLIYYFGLNAVVYSPEVDWNAALTNGYFLLWSSLVCGVAVYLYERLQRAEFEARHDLEAAYNHLRELDQLKSEFYANVSHELRTPLTLIIRGFRTLLRQLDDAERESVIETGLRNSARLLVLINNLLSLTRLDSGHANPVKHCIDLAELIRQVAANFESSESPQRIQLDGVGDVLTAEADPRQLKEVLYNLLSNAFKFNDAEQGRVWITLLAKDDAVIIEVRDNGIGIPSDQLDRIFDRFTQVEGSATRRYEGTGIGLALVKEIVTQHGGTISVTSTLGQGTTFALTLPRGDTTGQALFSLDDDEADLTDFLQRAVRSRPVKEGPELDHAGAETPLILVVEDNVDLRHYLQELLRPYYRVALGRDGAEGWAQTQALKPDLIVTDLMMPHMSGQDMLRLIRDDADLQSTPVIVLTARAGTQARLDNLESGADDYLTKPFDEDELRVRVRNLLRVRSQERDLVSLNQRLEARVEEQMAELVRAGELRRFLPQTVVKSVLQGEIDPEDHLQRRRVTVMFTDIVGFTELTDQMEPEDVSALLNDYLREMSAECVTRGGTMDKFIGSTVMVVFGAPQPQEETEHAWNALQTAVVMQQHLKKLTEVWRRRGIPRDLSLRIGMNTGYCTVGVFGSELLRNYTVVGAPVNLAAQLQQEAQAGMILCGLPTYALVQERVEARQFGPLTLRGVAHPVDAYEILNRDEEPK